MGILREYHLHVFLPVEVTDWWIPTWGIPSQKSAHTTVGEYPWWLTVTWAVMWIIHSWCYWCHLQILVNATEMFTLYIFFLTCLDFSVIIILHWINALYSFLIFALQFCCVWLLMTGFQTQWLKWSLVLSTWMQWSQGIFWWYYITVMPQSFSANVSRSKLYPILNKLGNKCVVY
jgi:hypothetical protein